MHFNTTIFPIMPPLSQVMVLRTYFLLTVRITCLRLILVSSERFEAFESEFVFKLAELHRFQHHKFACHASVIEIYGF